MAGPSVYDVNIGDNPLKQAALSGDNQPIADLFKILPANPNNPGHEAAAQKLSDDFQNLLTHTVNVPILGPKQILTQNIATPLAVALRAEPPTQGDPNSGLQGKIKKLWEEHPEALDAIIPKIRENPYDTQALVDDAYDAAYPEVAKNPNHRKTQHVTKEQGAKLQAAASGPNGQTAAAGFALTPELADKMVGWFTGFFDMVKDLPLFKGITSYFREQFASFGGKNETAPDTNSTARADTHTAGANSATPVGTPTSPSTPASPASSATTPVAAPDSSAPSLVPTVANGNQYRKTLTVVSSSLEQAEANIPVVPATAPQPVTMPMPAAVTIGATAKQVPQAPKAAAPAH